MNLDTLLQRAVDERASDLHLLPNLPPYLRIDGDLKCMHDEEILTPEILKTIALKLMNVEQQHIFDQELSIDMSIVLPDVGTFRVSIFHEKNGIACVFR